ncbi:MAG: T9SS type A sorting domain-containing protein [Bacteroidia bacterium]|nr:T9SS type A sorting domain-containing protein [Bacteroidia bacterium]
MNPVKPSLQDLALYALTFLKHLLLLILLGGSFSLQSMAQLNGNYSINPALPAGPTNYPSFALAFQALANQGINAPVHFEVSPGTYNEQLSIGPVTGASETDQIRFYSASGNATDVIIEYASILTGINYVLQLDGADFLIFENLSFRALSNSFARLLELDNGADKNSFLNCRFLGQIPPGNSSSSDYALVYCREFSNSNSSDANLFQGNLFQDGSWGMYCRNDGGSDKIRNFQLIDNQFLNQNWTALYFYQTEGNVIRGNEIRSSAISNGMFLRGQNEEDWLIQKNLLVLSNPSRLVYGLNLGIGKLGFRTEVSNNLINIDNSSGSAGARGISIAFCRDMDILYNTVQVSSGSILPSNSQAVHENTSSSSSWGPVHFQNNIFSNLSNGYVYSFRLNPSAGLGVMNHNIYHTQGTHLSDWAGTPLADIAALRSNTSKDAQSVERNPQLIAVDGELLVDASVFTQPDFAASPIASVSDDYFGDPRDANIPRKGASERNALGNIFPVEWLYVEAEQKGNEVLIYWATALELNHDYFTIQRSNTSLIWQDLARVSRPVSEGQVRAYEWTDPRPLLGNAVYRIAQKDIDGSLRYSKGVEISFQAEVDMRFYPNPVERKLRLSMSPEIRQITLRDISGKLLWKKDLSSSDDLVLDLAKLNAGVYLLSGLNQNGQRLLTKKLIRN